MKLRRLSPLAVLALAACAGKAPSAVVTPPPATPAAPVDGGLSPDSIAKQVMSQLPAVRQCFDQFAANASLAGKVMSRWTIEPNGATTAVAVDSPDPAVATCIVELIKTWRFHASSGSVTVSFPFVFDESPPDETVTGPTKARAVPTAAEISSVINDNRADIKKCYQRALLEDRGLTYGKITVKVAIETSGHVKNVEIQGPPKFQLLEPCIKERVGLWSFPQSGDGYGTEFSYVFQGIE